MDHAIAKAELDKLLNHAKSEQSQHGDASHAVIGPALGFVLQINDSGN